MGRSVQALVDRGRLCSLVAGHPKATKAAMFDIISQDLQHGSSASAAEAIAVVNECLDSFANLDKYEIRISHTKSACPLFACDSVSHLSSRACIQSRRCCSSRYPKSSVRKSSRFWRTQTRASLSGDRYLPRRVSLVCRLTPWTCLAIWVRTRSALRRRPGKALISSTLTDADVDAMVSRLEKVAPHMVSSITGAIREIKSTIEFASVMGVTRPVFFHPLYMIRNPSQFFKGLCFEVARKQSQKRADVLAVGGRYVTSPQWRSSGC